MALWGFVEKVKKTGWPKSARHFVGFPVELEYKEIPPQHDERIMCDGRPAYAWWNEIQMLRAKEPELQRQQIQMREQMVVLRIAEWALSRDMLSNDTLLRIKLSAMASDPLAELLNHPDKYVEKVEARGKHHG